MEQKSFARHSDDVTAAGGSWAEMAKKAAAIAKEVGCKIHVTPSQLKGHVRWRLATKNGADYLKKVGRKVYDEGIFTPEEHKAYLAAAAAAKKAAEVAAAAEQKK